MPPGRPPRSRSQGPWRDPNRAQPPPHGDGARGRWFHVVQRGVGRRPVFPCAGDIDWFLEQLARLSARGSTELHAYSILSNHCHLLLRSTPGDLSCDLRLLFAAYARRLNRRLQRDGPLFGSRSRVTSVTSPAHWRAAIAYIDRNAVTAGLAMRPEDYPFGSAWHYAHDSRPPWLTRDAIEAHVRRRFGAAEFDPAHYRHVFPAGVHASDVVARRLDQPARRPDPADDLLSSAPAHVRHWLERRARLADGCAAGPALVAPGALMEALAASRATRPEWQLAPRGRHRSGPRRDGWKVVAAGLLRLAAGLALAEIAERLGTSTSGAHYLVRQHRDLLRSDAAYAACAQRLLSAALRRTHGQPRTGELCKNDP